MQGAWGKRSPNDSEDIDDEALEEEELQVYPETLARMVAAPPVKRGWALWGKRPDYPAVSPRSTNWSSLRGAAQPLAHRGGSFNNTYFTESDKHSFMSLSNNIMNVFRMLNDYRGRRH